MARSRNDAVGAIEQCIQAIRSWMIKDKLRMNDSKTEFMIIGTRKQLTQVNIDGPTVGESGIAPVTSVRNLGSWFDQNLSMIPRINKICKAASFHIYNIRWIKKYLTNDATHTLVHSIVIRRLDYCNSLLYKVPASEIVLPGSYVQHRGLIILHSSYFLCIGYPLSTVSSLKS